MARPSAVWELAESAGGISPSRPPEPKFMACGMAAGGQHLTLALTGGVDVPRVS